MLNGGLAGAGALHLAVNLSLNLNPNWLHGVCRRPRRTTTWARRRTRCSMAGWRAPAHCTWRCSCPLQLAGSGGPLTPLVLGTWVAATAVAGGNLLIGSRD